MGHNIQAILSTEAGKHSPERIPHFYEQGILIIPLVEEAYYELIAIETDIQQTGNLDFFSYREAYDFVRLAEAFGLRNFVLLDNCRMDLHGLMVIDGQVHPDILKTEDLSSGQIKKTLGIDVMVMDNYRSYWSLVSRYEEQTGLTLYERAPLPEKEEKKTSFWEKTKRFFRTD